MKAFDGHPRPIIPILPLILLCLLLRLPLRLHLYLLALSLKWLSIHLVELPPSIGCLLVFVDHFLFSIACLFASGFLWLFFVKAARSAPRSGLALTTASESTLVEKQSPGEQFPRRLLGDRPRSSRGSCCFGCRLFGRGLLLVVRYGARCVVVLIPVASAWGAAARLLPARSRRRGPRLRGAAHRAGG